MMNGFNDGDGKGRERQGGVNAEAASRSVMSALFAARQRIDYIVLFEEGSDYGTI